MQPTVVNFALQEFKPLEPCRCSVDEVKQILAPFNGPNPPFLPAYRGSKA